MTDLFNAVANRFVEAIVFAKRVPYDKFKNPNIDDDDDRKNWDMLPITIKRAFVSPFNIGLGKYKIILNGKGGMELIKHLKRYGLEIREINDNDNKGIK